MIYKNITTGGFIDRPNRFIAHVEIDGLTDTVHVKNTGRCKELLIPGAEVVLSKSDNPKRKTKYDLIAVYKEKLGLVNIDSQAPNHVVQEWLEELPFDLVKPEYTYDKSRIDFYMEKGEKCFLLEVKGCTLERDGIGYFPDAPTERGVKHFHEMRKAAGEGYHAAVAFTIPMPGVVKVLPNDQTQPGFGEALREAEDAGVRVLYLPCLVKTDAVCVDRKKAAELNSEFVAQLSELDCGQ